MIEMIKVIGLIFGLLLGMALAAGAGAMWGCLKADHCAKQYLGLKKPISFTPKPDRTDIIFMRSF